MKIIETMDIILYLCRGMVENLKRGRLLIYKLIAWTKISFILEKYSKGESKCGHLELDGNDQGY